MTEIISRLGKIGRHNKEYMTYYMDNASKTAPSFRITTISKIRGKYENIQDQIHAHGFYVAIWFTEGKGKHIVDFAEYEITPNTVFFLSPFHLHQIANMNECEGWVITFNEDFLFNEKNATLLKLKHELFHRHDIAPYCTLPESATDNLYEIIKNINKEMETNSEEYAHSDYLFSLVSMYLFSIKRFGIWPQALRFYPNIRATETFLKFKELVEECFCQEHEVQNYAEKLNISTKTLAAYTQECGNTTPLKLINDRIIVEAKRILIFTPMPIKSVAQSVGFDDVSYFIKFFKRLTGISPLEFRSIE